MKTGRQRLSGPRSEIPTVTAEQMREVDDWTVAAGIGLIQMMENAGRAVALLARRHLGAGANRGAVIVAAGHGGNGGGGMVAARRLALWGEQVTVHLSSDRQRMSETVLQQARALDAVGVVVHPPGVDLQVAAGDVVIDALLGYSLRGTPSGDVARLVGAVNAAGDAGASVVSVDVPSGLDPNSGRPTGVTVRADLTVTLALPKCGLTTAEGQPWVGQLWLADIGVPPAAFTRLGISPGNVFETCDILELHREA